MDPPRVRVKQQKGQAVGFPAAAYSELACERHVDGRVKAEEPRAGCGFQCIIQLDHVHSSPPPLTFCWHLPPPVVCHFIFSLSQCCFTLSGA